MGKPPRKKRTPKYPTLTTESWKTPVYWRNLLFYFLFFSFIGHYIEMVLITLVHLLFDAELNTNILANPIEPYTIYGLGAVLCILLVKPLTKKYNHNLPATFTVATLVCAALEYFSSIALTFRYGHNPYWDYRTMPLNLDGHICLGNTLFFGLLATAFLRLIFPFFELHFFKKTPKPIINLILFALFALFAFYYLTQALTF